MKDLKTVSEKMADHVNWKWFCFIFVLLISLFYSCIKDITNYEYDAAYYWGVAGTVFSDGKFELLKFPETFRGYFCPVIMYAVRMFGEHILHNGAWGYWLFSAMLVAVFFTFILPSLFEKPISGGKSILRMLLVLLPVFLFWGDLLQYPLSDFPACVLLCGGAAIIKVLHRKKCVGKKELVFGGGAGFCLYAAYNTRATCLYGALLVIFLFIWYERKSKKLKWNLLIAMLVGGFICALPQSLINHQYTASYLPKVFTEQYCNYERGLQAQQVFWGITWQSYETYAGESEDYPMAAVYFADEAGKEILAREGIQVADFSYGDWFRLVRKYPLDMCGIYTRHLVSLLTPKFLETYIFNIYPSKGMIVTLSILIWLCAGVYFLFSFKHKGVDYKKICIIFSCFIPCFLQIFGAPELRFFLSIHFITYFYVLYYTENGECLKWVKENIIIISVVFFLVYMFWISIVGDILKSNQERTLLINDYKVTVNVNENKGESYVWKKWC